MREEERKERIIQPCDMLWITLYFSAKVNKLSSLYAFTVHTPSILQCPLPLRTFSLYFLGADPNPTPQQHCEKTSTKKRRRSYEKGLVMPATKRKKTRANELREVQTPSKVGAKSHFFFFSLGDEL